MDGPSSASRSAGCERDVLYVLRPDGEAGETRVGVRETGDAVVGIGIDGTAAVSSESCGGADLRPMALV